MFRKDYLLVVTSEEAAYTKRIRRIFSPRLRTFIRLRFMRDGGGGFSGWGLGVIEGIQAAEPLPLITVRPLLLETGRLISQSSDWQEQAYV